jgi:cell division protein FtsQ
VQSLGGGQDRRQTAVADDRGGLVLPRPLRRPVRLMNRLFGQGAIFSPRMLALFGGAALLGATGAGVLRGGQLMQWAELGSHRAGIVIGDIEISGANEVSRIDVLTAMDLGPRRSMIAFDVHGAREDIKHLAWVRDARIAKAYPDRILVEIVERQPFAIWQNGQALFLVERDGSEIAPYDPRHVDLPLVVGRGANRHAADLIAAVARHPQLSSRVGAYVRLGDRRWDLRLDNGAVAMLPEGAAGAGVDALARLVADGDILDRAVETIDLRLADRVVLKLAPQAAQARREAAAGRTRKSGGAEKRT